LKNYKIHILLLSLVLLLKTVAFSQEDSLIIYYNRGSIADVASGERIIEKYTAKDSIQLFWVASKISKKENKVKFYHSVGHRFYKEDNYEMARMYYSKALDFARLTLDKRMIADQLSDVGDMFRLQDQNTSALNLLLQAMYLYKELGTQKELAHTLSLIGDLNRCIDQHEDALKYLNEGLVLAIKNDYKKDQTFCYSSIGGTYQALKQYEKANASYEKGLAIAVSERDTMRIIDFYYSIGDLFLDQNKLNKAIEYLSEGIRLCIQHKDRYYLAYCRIGLSKAYLKLKKYDQSIEEGNIAYKISEEMSVYGLCAEASDVLYQAYFAKQDFPNAFKYLKISKDNADSSISSSIIKQQAQMEINFKNSYQEKQDSLLRFSAQKQKDLEHEAALQKQKMFATAGIAGLLIVLVIAIMVYRSYKKEKRSSQIINQQKTIVDTKNKEILDSINYARKIQQAIIPSHAELKATFPDSFVLLMPKDIVSGDFYWITKTGQQAFFAVADCTGHGVPGGFMSMLGTALLNEIINEKNIYEPADILDMLRLKIVMALRQSDNANENKDGMDIALIQINLNTQELTFAGANNSMYLLRDNKLREFKGDKFPVGFEGKNDKQFTQQKFKLEPNDLIYMFTDGYPDQFGGPQGKKFKYKPLEEMLEKMAKQPMEEQRHLLLNKHEDWKGKLEQVDDICVAGIRIV